MKPIIAIDFDGVIVEDRYPDIGAIQPGAQKYISKLFDYCNIIIWTSRDGLQLEIARQWLTENQIPFHYLNRNCDEVVKKYGGDSRKIYADIYLDDRQLMPFPGWERSYELILSILHRNRPKSRKYGQL